MDVTNLYLAHTKEYLVIYYNIEEIHEFLRNQTKDKEMDFIYGFFSQFEVELTDSLTINPLAIGLAIFAFAMVIGIIGNLLIKK